ALAYRERLKAEGVPAAVAYERMLAAFPPLATGGAGPSPPLPQPQTPGAPSNSEAQPARRRRRRRSQGRIDWTREILWVYDHLTEGSGERGAPSDASPALLAWARKNPDDFFKTFVARLVPTAPKPEEPRDRREVEPAREALEEFMRAHGMEPGKSRKGVGDGVDRPTLIVEPGAADHPPAN
ncbi:MAG TPA: hypothetical protein VKA46_13990, partial [Gemmataceae bacterium]|nr:hypothetical protein [Gemmataceae bacterium]